MVKFPCTRKTVVWEVIQKGIYVMYGAILGDIVGSPYEFDMGNKSKDFDFWDPRAQFTDDSVLTVAVADALMRAGKNAKDEKINSLVKQSLRSWALKYPGRGYGYRFGAWIKTPEKDMPYNSFGNGSAMRVSSVGWLYNTLEKTQSVAKITAEVTHNHPEGIKGAQAIASAIFLARTGHTKEDIKNYITEEYGYDLTKTCDEIRPTYRHDESCQRTVPEAITAFLESNDFEDAIRTAVSLGGDCDTLTCITGSIAEAFYGVPADMKKVVETKIDKNMLKVLRRFTRIIAQDAPSRNIVSRLCGIFRK